MFNRLDSIPACDKRTDGQTDIQTDILQRHSPRYAYASRGNKTILKPRLAVAAQRQDVYVDFPDVKFR